MFSDTKSEFSAMFTDDDDKELSLRKEKTGKRKVDVNKKMTIKRRPLPMPSQHTSCKQDS